MIIANGHAICNSLGMFFSLQREFLAAEGPMVQATVSFYTGQSPDVLWYGMCKSRPSCTGLGGDIRAPWNMCGKKVWREEGCSSNKVGGSCGGGKQNWSTAHTSRIGGCLE